MVTVEASTGPSFVFSVSETGESGDLGEGGDICRAGTGEVGIGISFKLRPSILLTFHSVFGEIDIFARNTEISFGLDTEAKRLLYVHK